MSDKKHFFFTLATFVGTIIGVGIFGLPYVATQSGFLTLVLYLIFGAVIVYIINHQYGVIASTTRELHRLPGYVGLYLGPRVKRFALVVEALALFGALVAYLVIGGSFLANLFGGSVILYTFVFFIVGALLVWQDSGSIGPVEFIMMLLFVVMIVLLFVFGAEHIRSVNFFPVNAHNLFLPYGIVLFSFWGAPVIPEIREELKGNANRFKLVMRWGVIISLLVYLGFSFLIVGMSGAETTKDAISGLQENFGRAIIFFGYVFGLITTFTSYISLGLSVKKLFWYDYKLPRFLAWLTACFVPLILYMVGIKDFISIVSLTGAVMVGCFGVLVILTYLKLKSSEQNHRRAWISLGSSFLIALLLLGVAMEIIQFVKGA